MEDAWPQVSIGLPILALKIRVPLQLQILLAFLAGIPFYSSGQKSFNENGKFGFTQNGKIIIEPQYEYAADFIEGLACVKKNGKWGYINPNNTWVSKEYEKIQPLSRGFGKVYANGKFGMVDSEGTEIFPTEYDDLYINYDGHYILQKNELKGLRSTNISIPCLYTSTGQYHDDFAFGKNEDGKYHALYTSQQQYDLTGHEFKVAGSVNMSSLRRISGLSVFPFFDNRLLACQRGGWVAFHLISTCLIDRIRVPPIVRVFYGFL